MGKGLFCLFLAAALLSHDQNHVHASRSSCISDIVAGVLTVKVDGESKEVYVIDPNKGNAGTVLVEGNKVSLGHGPRIYLGDKCAQSMNENLFWYPNLAKYTMSFKIDLSGIGCGCNGALYLVNMPAPSQTSCGDYYCDANYVCGIGCSEFDIVEANNQAGRVTAHECSTSTTCDSSGCGFQLPSFGPSKKMNTNKKITVIVQFTQGAAFVKYKQGDVEHSITFDDESCGSGYMESMSRKWMEMVITASSWGDSGDGMAWLDGDVCNTNENCNHGVWSFSDVKFYTTNKNNDGWSSFIEWVEETHTWWQWILFAILVVLLFTVLTLSARYCCQRTEKGKSVVPPISMNRPLLNQEEEHLHQQQRQRELRRQRNQMDRHQSISTKSSAVSTNRSTESAQSKKSLLHIKYKKQSSSPPS